MIFPSCLDCVRKHLATAFGFLVEAHGGYRQHRWLAVGELYHAEIESRGMYPELADEIMRTRRVVMKSHRSSKDADIFKLICMASYVAGEYDDLEPDPTASKVYDYLLPKPPIPVEMPHDHNLLER